MKLTKNEAELSHAWTQAHFEEGIPYKWGDLDMKDRGDLVIDARTGLPKAFVYYSPVWKDHKERNDFLRCLSTGFLEGKEHG